MSDYTFPYSYLSIFLNPLLRSGNVVTFSLSAPALGNVDLCNFSLDQEGPEIHTIVSSSQYSKKIKSLTYKIRKDYLLNEIPEYRHFQDVFFHSAILKPSGLDELVNYITDASQQSVIRGGDVFYIAFDTNVLRDRIYTNYLRQYSDAPNLDFILSETVRSELTNRREKIKRRTVHELCKLFGPTGQNFLNQNVLADRLRYIGFLEYNRIRHETDCDQLRPARAVNNKDEEIIHTYASFAVAGHNRKVLLLSRDNEFIRMSPSLPDVIPLILESRFPGRLQKPLRCSYNELYSFVYHLSVLYGQVDITLKGHTLYKCSVVWPQKNVRQWENAHIKIEANKALPFLETINHHTSILKNMRYKKEISRFPKTE